MSKKTTFLPTNFQFKEQECIAANMAMILNHFKIKTSTYTLYQKIKETNTQSPSSHIKTLSKQFGLKCQTQTEAISVKHDTTASSDLSNGIKFLYSFFRGISTKNVKNYSTNLEALEIGANHKVNDEIDLHTITTPAILSWKNNHFIIFEGIKNKKI